MSASDTCETSLLQLLFTNTNSFANLGDATGLRGSSTAGSLYISLHTADPLDAAASGQSTSEIAYTSYARVAVARSGSGWTVSGNSASNAAAINFPACTGSSGTASFFGVGVSSSGTGTLLFSGALTSSLAISSGITPSFAIGQLTVTAD